MLMGNYASKGLNRTCSLLGNPFIGNNIAPLSRTSTIMLPMFSCTAARLVLFILTVKLVCHHALLLPKKMPFPKLMADLRSDTITKPSPPMRKAMFEAEVGDDVYEEDPTVRKLEERMATLFKKDKSLFFPTGTMANLAASMAWCSSRGSEVILGDQSHMHIYEQANLAQMGGISPRSVANNVDGTLDLDLLAHAIRATNIHFPTTEMIALENTHNLCGGRVLSAAYMESVGSLAQRAGVPLHLDGARIWNAAAASKTSVASLTAHVDSVSACLSKGLGAPAGSMLVGPATFIAKARRIRKALGGGMRQVGVLAAAGLQALDDFDQGILDVDHRKARNIAQGIAEISGLRVDPVETNIVLVHMDDPLVQATAFAAKLQEQGVKVLPRGAHSMRIVTHRDFLEEDVPAVVAAFRSVASSLWVAKASSAGVLPALVLTGLMKPDFVPVNVTTESPVGEVRATKNSTAPTASSASKPTSSVTAAVTAPVMVTHSNSTFQTGASKSAANVSSPHHAHAVNTPAVAETAATTTSASSIAPGVTSYSVVGTTTTSAPLVHYEEASIRGMSVSPDGFCVILQGTVSNRCVRVLVTPEDPMSDGLDQDEVESSEAVTLLQLLQGIDIESFLAKDALVTKFSSTGPAGARVKYDLKAVLVNDAGKGRKFHGVLAGSPRVRPKTVAPPTPDKTREIEIDKNGTTGSESDASLNVHVEAAKNVSAHQAVPPVSLETSPLGAESEALANSNHSVTHATSSGFEREVPLDSAFYAIALALRHHVPIEVRSDLLQNEKISFSEREIAIYYPKLLAASVKLPSVTQAKDRTHMVERLKKRLTEALRQRNAEKIAQIQDQIASLGVVPPVDAPIMTTKTPLNATKPVVHETSKEAAVVEASAAASVVKLVESLNATQTIIVSTAEPAAVSALHSPHDSHRTSPIV